MAEIVLQIAAILAGLIVASHGLGQIRPHHSYIPQRFYTLPPTTKLPPLPPNPCKDQPLVDSVEQGSGPIICLRASESDLEKQLQQSGGFIKRYVGIRNQDICNFTDPSSFVASLNIPQFPATPTPPAHLQRDSTYAEGVSPAHFGHRRTKRATTTSTLKCIGKATRNSDTGFYSMCDQCWAITTLDDTRFPRRINEVLCGTTGEKDAQGEPVCWQKVGRCIQKVIKLDFLQWNGEYEDVPTSTPARRIVRQKFVSYTQEVRSCCECELDPRLFLRN